MLTDLELLPLLGAPQPEKIPKFSPNLSKIDIYYYSSQEFKTKPIIDVVKNLNLTLIKKFEVNNKVSEIYLVNK